MSRKIILATKSSTKTSKKWPPEAKSESCLPKGQDQIQVFTSPCRSKKEIKFTLKQYTKKVVTDSPGLVDFAIGLVNNYSVLNLPNGQIRFFGEFKLQKNSL